MLHAPNIQPKSDFVRTWKVNYARKILVSSHYRVRDRADRDADMEIAIYIVIAFAAGMLYRDLRHTNQIIKEHTARIEKLESANKQRLPYRSQEEILDAMAALDALQHELSFKNNLVDNAKAHLSKSMQVGTTRE